MRSRILPDGRVVCLVCLIPGVTRAHFVITPYILPVPLWMYVYGCAATLVVTFAVSEGFAKDLRKHDVASGRYLRVRGLIGALTSGGLWLLRVAAACCLLLTVLSGTAADSTAMPFSAAPE